jgi:hypothetical protein
MSISCLALFATLACGDNRPPTSTTFTGNWQITLNRHVNPVPLLYTGFLVQTGKSVSGSVVLGDGCQGVGPVTGAITGQSFQLTINEFGQAINLSGDLPSGSAPLDGQFSTLAGACTQFPSTGSWSAAQIKPLTGTFHGSLVSTNSNALVPSLDVTGIITQGPNIGASSATLSGTLTAASYVAPCAYLTNATITGTISGTTVVWNLYGTAGTPMGRIPLPGGLPGGPPTATISVDGSSLTGSYQFQPISSTCGGDQGSVQLTFP